MPVNPLPVLIPLLVVWSLIVYFLFRWRRVAGAVFVTASVIGLVVLFMNSGVERRHDEPMSYHLVDAGDFGVVELTTSRGDRVTASSPDLIARLRGHPDGTVNVSMTAWYDFGKLRGYRVHTVDGISP